jgi:hypothetical protein
VTIVAPAGVLFFATSRWRAVRVCPV